jgi:hypothetical protein
VLVTDEDGRDAELHWVGSEPGRGIEHRALGGEERWTGVFRIPGDVLRERRAIVASIREDALLPDSEGKPPAIGLPRFNVSVPLQEN